MRTEGTENVVVGDLDCRHTPHRLCLPAAPSSTQAPLCPFDLVGTSSPTSENLALMSRDAFRHGSRGVLAAAPASICSGAAKLACLAYSVAYKMGEITLVVWLQLTKWSEVLQVLSFKYGLWLERLTGRPG